MSGIDETKDFITVRIAVLTVSDTRSAADDRSGDTLVDRLTSAGHLLADRGIVSDASGRSRTRSSYRPCTINSSPAPRVVPGPGNMAVALPSRRSTTAIENFSRAALTVSPSSVPPDSLARTVHRCIMMR